MTKKHYEAIAAAFRPYIVSNTGANIARPIAKDLADYFATDNKNFDRARFLQACGIEAGPQCHLCGTTEEQGYCTNKTCYEYTRHE